jgi:hypothetical protein
LWECGKRGNRVGTVAIFSFDCAAFQIWGHRSSAHSHAYSTATNSV